MPQIQMKVKVCEQFAMPHQTMYFLLFVARPARQWFQLVFLLVLVSASGYGRRARAGMRRFRLPTSE
jgi:hypothetical protein